MISQETNDSLDSVKIFLCPFNAYHKFYDQRK